MVTLSINHGVELKLTFPIGLANTLVGLLSLILGPIDHLVKNQLHGNYNIVNAAWLILGFVAATLLSWSIRRGSTLRERDTSSGELH